MHRTWLGVLTICVSATCVAPSVLAAIVYFTGGDQKVCGDLQRAECAGTPRELFDSFFGP